MLAYFLTRYPEQEKRDPPYTVGWPLRQQRSRQSKPDKLAERGKRYKRRVAELPGPCCADPEEADYELSMECGEGEWHSGLFRKDNAFLFSESGPAFNRTVRDACKTINQDLKWHHQSSEPVDNKRSGFADRCERAVHASKWGVRLRTIERSREARHVMDKIRRAVPLGSLPVFEETTQPLRCRLRQ